MSMFEKRRKLTHGEEKKIDGAVVDFIFNDMRPFTVVDGHGFTNLVKCLNPDYALKIRNIPYQGCCCIYASSEQAERDYGWCK